MARSRKIHTDISIETKLNRVSDFAALLYSWMIPHARDDCRLPKRDPEELRLLILPGRQKTAADVQAAIDELVREMLIGVDDDGFYFFPAEVFYKYQSYIGHKNRRNTPKINKINDAENSGDCRRSAEISGEVRGLAENSASPSLSPSPSPSGLLAQPSSSARAGYRDRQGDEERGRQGDKERGRQGDGVAVSGSPSLPVSSSADLGLGERHPAKIVGWTLWGKLESFWRANGKRLGIVQLELYGQQLIEFRRRGHDPTVIVETTLRREWLDLYEPDKDAGAPASEVYDFEAIRSAAADRAKSRMQ